MDKIDIIIRKDKKGYRARIFISFTNIERYSSDSLSNLLVIISDRTKQLLEI